MLVMERTRMIFDADETMRRAIKIYAAKNATTVSEAINHACRTMFAAELREAERIISGEDAKPKRKSE